METLLFGNPIQTVHTLSALHLLPSAIPGSDVCTHERNVISSVKYLRPLQARILKQTTARQRRQQRARTARASKYWAPEHVKYCALETRMKMY